MMFRDELVQSIKEAAEMRLSDLISDQEMLGRVEELLVQFRTARGFPAENGTAAPKPTFRPATDSDGHLPLFAVIVHGPEGQQRYEFNRREITIGRSSESDLVLRRTDISRRHARLVMREGHLLLLDLKSENGTYTNGQRVSSPQVVHPVDQIAIGDYQLFVELI